MTTTVITGDRLELVDLVSRLGLYLDEHRFAELAGLFAADASIETPGGTAEGVEAVVAQATRNHLTHSTHQHLLTNVLVDLDGDDATIRANAVSVWVRAGLAPEFALGAVYRFRAHRGPAGWLLARLEISPVWRRDA